MSISFWLQSLNLLLKITALLIWIYLRYCLYHFVVFWRLQHYWFEDKDIWDISKRLVDKYHLHIFVLSTEDSGITDLKIFELLPSLIEKYCLLPIYYLNCLLKIATLVIWWYLRYCQKTFRQIMLICFRAVYWRVKVAALLIWIYLEILLTGSLEKKGYCISSSCMLTIAKPQKNQWSLTQNL